MEDPKKQSNASELADTQECTEEVTANELENLSGGRFTNVRINSTGLISPGTSATTVVP